MTLTTLVSTSARAAGRLPAIAEVIRAKRPDAVALLEATDQAMAEALARAVDMDLTFGEANNGYHLAWLSRLPVLRWENHKQLPLAKTLLEIEIAWADGTGRLFAAHLSSRHDATTPVDEVSAILTALHPLNGQPHLLVGDFNALRPGDPVGTPPQGETRRGDAAFGALRRAIGQLIEAGYVDCYRTRHPQSPGHTYPSTEPWLRLDYIFASPAMADRLITCDLIAGKDATRASDHLPVWARFAGTSA